MNWLNITLDANDLLVAAAPPVTATLIILAVQVLVIRNISDRKQRTRAILVSSALQGLAMVLWLLAWVVFIINN